MVRKPETPQEEYKVTYTMPHTTITDLLLDVTEARVRSMLGTTLLLRNAIEEACRRGEYGVSFQTTDWETVESILKDKKYHYTKTRLPIPYEWYEFYISW